MKTSNFFIGILVVTTSILSSPLSLAGTAMKPGNSPPNVKALYAHVNGNQDVKQILDILNDAPNLFGGLKKRPSTKAEIQQEIADMEKTYSAKMCIDQNIKIKKIMGQPVNRMAETAICNKRIQQGIEGIKKGKRLSTVAGSATDIRISEIIDMSKSPGSSGMVSGKGANVIITYKKKDPVDAVEGHAILLKDLWTALSNDPGWHSINVKQAIANNIEIVKKAQKERAEIYKKAGASKEALKKVGKIHAKSQDRISKITTYIKKIQGGKVQVTISNYWKSGVKYTAGILKGRSKADFIMILVGYEGNLQRIIITTTKN